MNTLACDTATAADSRVCCHNLQRECLFVCVCVVVVVGGGVGVGCCEIDCMNVEGRGGAAAAEEAVWQQDSPAVLSSVYTHMHSCAPHNPILP